MKWDRMNGTCGTRESDISNVLKNKSPNLRRKEKGMKIRYGFKWPTPRNLVTKLRDPRTRKFVELYKLLRRCTMELAIGSILE